MDSSSSDDSSPTRSPPVTRRRLLGAGGGLASALGIGAGVPRKVQASGGASTDDAESDTVGGLYAVATDTDGSSEDSRVALGTLDHHHEWANTAPSELHFDEASAGTQRWRFDTGDAATPPTIVHGTVFVGSGNHVYALDAETADQQWRFTTEDVISTAPQVVGEHVFIGSRNYVYALDAETGDEQWRSDTVTRISGQRAKESLTVANETVYVGSIDHNVYALDTESGEELWRFEADADEGMASSPTVVDGIVFVGGYDNVYAVDAETGDEQWRFTQRGHRNTTPQVVAGTVFFGSTDNHVYALDAGTGDE